MFVNVNAHENYSELSLGGHLSKADNKFDPSILHLFFYK